jgi:hypothetical protein
MPYDHLKALENLSENTSSSQTPQLDQSMVMNFSPGWNEEKIAGLLTKATYSADARAQIRQIPDEDLKKFSTTSKGIPRMFLYPNARVIRQIPPDALAEFARTDEGIQTILTSRNSHAIRAISDENLRKFSKTIEGISRMLVSQDIRVIEQIPLDTLADFATTDEGIEKILVSHSACAIKLIPPYRLEQFATTLGGIPKIVASHNLDAVKLIPPDRLEQFTDTPEGISKILASRNPSLIEIISIKQWKAFAKTSTGSQRISTAWKCASARHFPYPYLYQYVLDLFGTEPMSDLQLSAKRQYILNSTVSRTCKECLLAEISPERYEQIASSWKTKTIKTWTPRSRPNFFTTRINDHSNYQPRDQQRPEKRVLAEPWLPQKRNKIDDAANELIHYPHNFPAQAADNRDLEPNQNGLWRPWSR